MRQLRFLPLAFLSGVDGFALFVPYLTLLLVVTHVARTPRTRSALAELRGFSQRLSAGRSRRAGISGFGAAMQPLFQVLVAHVPTPEYARTSEPQTA